MNEEKMNPEAIVHYTTVIKQLNALRPIDSPNKLFPDIVTAMELLLQGKITLDDQLDQKQLVAKYKEHGTTLA